MGLFFQAKRVDATQLFLVDQLCTSSFIADKPLAAFLAGAFPAADRKCPQPSCGDGATHHLRTFVHRGQRVTLSVAQLPAGHELPGGDRGQVPKDACSSDDRVVLCCA